MWWARPPGKVAKTAYIVTEKFWLTIGRLEARFQSCLQGMPRHEPVSTRLFGHLPNCYSGNYYCAAGAASSLGRQLGGNRLIAIFLLEEYFSTHTISLSPVVTF